MKRSSVVCVLAVSLLLLFGFTDTSAPALPEKTVVLRVRTVDGKRPGTISGMYKIDTGEEFPISGGNFGVMLKSESISGYVKKESGEDKIYVEVIGFSGKVETSCLSSNSDQVSFESKRINGVDSGTINPYIK